MSLIKYCKNPECGLEITKYKSSKRSYCYDRCKNRANFIKRSELQMHLTDIDKAIRKNYKILNKLREMDLGPIYYQTLKSHGFDFDAIHKAEPFLDDDGKQIFLNHVYDIYFIMVNQTLIFKK